MIKLFEEYNEFYTEIDADEYDVSTEIYALTGRDSFDEHNQNWVEFTQSEISTLRDLIIAPYRINPFTVSSAPKSYIEFVYKKEHPNNGKVVVIIKTKDEWYYVRIAQYAIRLYKYYKCDQWEGLLKCLIYNI